MYRCGTSTACADPIVRSVCLVGHQRYAYVGSEPGVQRTAATVRSGDRADPAGSRSGRPAAARQRGRPGAARQHRRQPGLPRTARHRRLLGRARQLLYQHRRPRPGPGRCAAGRRHRVAGAAAHRHRGDRPRGAAGGTRPGRPHHRTGRRLPGPARGLAALPR
ncbi:hypothetical protein SBRY_20114 [Actinacidiphila bryophytorum]|uniref:Uncharacterized protein n=1 Tax=Actinacidiphila bryophytorum TaxID=1436133 RepID=A0A9W4H000_9ACTN|nr:hypothetical protein SBRY_20114 [Actinacidiphila bryophytorum]